MQLLLHLPESLAERFKQMVPVRQRSAFVANLPEQALPEEDDPLYRIALEVERDAALTAQARPPIVVPLPSAGKDSVAVCDQLCAADKLRFGKKIGELSSADLAVLTESMKIVLGLM